MYHSKEHFEESKKEKLITGVIMLIVGVIFAIISLLKFMPKKDWVWGFLAVVAFVVVILGGVLIAGKL
jgi:uncharacterized membrane protein